MSTSPDSSFASRFPAVLKLGARLSRYSECLLAAASLAAIPVFIFVGINRSVWLDEGYTILISSLPFSRIAETLRHENNFPLYFFLLAFWMRLFGNSEAALRALSAIFYVCGGAVTFALARRVWSNARLAGYAAFFYLSSALAIHQAQNIRMYALLGMLSGLSILAFFRRFLQQDRSARANAFFVLVNALGILTHVWFAFVLIGQFFGLILFHSKQVRAWITSLALAALPFLLLWSPGFVDQLRNGATSWMPGFDLRFLALAPVEFYGLLPSIVLYGLAAGLWLMAGPEKRRQVLAGENLGQIFTIFVMALTFPLLVSLARPIYAPGRYVIIALAPLAVLLAALLSSLSPRPALPVLGMLLLAAGIANQIANRNTIPESDLPPGQSDRTTAEFLLEHAARGDAIVFTSLTRAAADYYFLRARAESRFLEISYPADTATHLGWLDPLVPPQRRPPLESEADTMARQLQQVIGSGHRVWLYAGGTPDVTAILLAKLDSALPRPRVHTLWGPYHRSLLEYVGS